MVKKKSVSKQNSFHSIEEIKVKIFPNLAKKEALSRVQDNFGMIGTQWANESIDRILAKH